MCKALGTGILASGIGMRDVEVVRDSHGKPAIALHGAAARIAEEQGVIDVPLSITYTHSVAVANAVAITKASQAEREKRRDVKAELAQQFKEMRGMLDDLGEQNRNERRGQGCRRAGVRIRSPHYEDDYFEKRPRACCRIFFLTIISTRAVSVNLSWATRFMPVRACLP